MCRLQAIDFTEQGRKAIKSSNLLRTKWFTMDTRMSECGTHMFLFQVNEEAFPLEWNLDYVHPAHDQQSASMALQNCRRNGRDLWQQHSPGKEAGANQITEHCNTTGSQTHRQRGIVGILRIIESKKWQKSGKCDSASAFEQWGHSYHGAMQLYSIQLKCPRRVEKTEFRFTLFQPARMQIVTLQLNIKESNCFFLQWPNNWITCAVGGDPPH